MFTATPTAELSTLSLHDALPISLVGVRIVGADHKRIHAAFEILRAGHTGAAAVAEVMLLHVRQQGDRKSTRLNSSHSQISYAVFCLKKKNQREHSKRSFTATLRS